MNLWPFRPAKPSQAARELSNWNALNSRERVKARTRAMREELGLPPLKVLL